MRLYEDVRTKMKEIGDTIRFYFSSHRISKYGKTFHECLRLIVLKNILITFVEDGELRKSSRFEVHLSMKTVVQVLFPVGRTGGEAHFNRTEKE
eukprot:IDg11069t1